MAIESRIPTEELNVKDLELERPEGNSELEKQFEQRLVDPMKPEILELTQKVKQSLFYWNKSYVLLSAKHLLSSEEFENNYASVQKDTENALAKFLGILGKFSNTSTKVACRLKTIAPKLYEKDFNNDAYIQTCTGEISRQLTERESVTKYRTILDNAYKIKTLDPNADVKYFGTDTMESIKKNLGHTLNEMRKVNWDMDKTPQNLDLFLQDVYHLTALFPEQVAHLGLKLENDDWKFIFRAMQNKPLPDDQTRIDYIENLEHIKGLLAEKILFTDHGVEFVMHKNLSSEGNNKVLPEVKKF